jgi:hypothetical protein
MSSTVTKQGVKNLNSMGRRPPRVDKCPPCTPSKWKLELAFPNAAFDDWESYEKRARRRCLHCNGLMDDKEPTKELDWASDSDVQFLSLRGDL